MNELFSFCHWVEPPYLCSVLFSVFLGFRIHKLHFLESLPNKLPKVLPLGNSDWRSKGRRKGGAIVCDHGYGHKWLDDSKLQHLEKNMYSLFYTCSGPSRGSDFMMNSEQTETVSNRESVDAFSWISCLHH